MIDVDGFRPNVGIMLANAKHELLWARRIGQNAWQFPQGGIDPGENAEQALFRELREEIGLTAGDVQILGCTRGWLRYYLPKRFIRRNAWPRCIGQKQVWFLLRLTAAEDRVRLDLGPKPEFDHWRWVPYWHPVNEVVFFKRRVYRRALQELEPLLTGANGGFVGTRRPRNPA
ncbi:RNA pyrophosphohydrolase [Candidatus Macondimonas diazotrophica]|uniref:RNA pyrophosphohydrolase n=1 Tax=Candidatus Macondimonas diazotrophica TaxID=2305248 RepID=A0A4Z0F9U6_9GAMM|nr:RNA pyrophosphohydrolase [Candidatus Macondimonas diazotrophica]NCU00975.1 RNA pyrophosphohydrolase [Candidatus Macondimonas diazotrophica]TFZ83206.1 RNA pyrophosphohydrolase [Candidatus Macondimonas diazotrophica]